ncbi:MAG: hypothetical protein QOK40_504 [Miltoncostaeaceae bacterium]|jgi:putative flippase GtrA|nr:hypothetical protein [Miltoncostaeaceae bacterium]
MLRELNGDPEEVNAGSWATSAAAPAHALNGTRGRPALSIVLPTKDEAENVEALVARLETALPDIPGRRYQVIFVDDSDDDTPKVVEAARERSRHEIVLIHRPRERRGDGLGGAVVEGFRAATAPWVCVMDADLQHPPELIPTLLREGEQSGVDMVVASRYNEGRSETEGLSAIRSLVSKGLTAAAKLVMPAGVRNVADPLSGFFMVRRDALKLDTLRPKGFKILLEILARTPGLKVREVPFEFGRRHAGQSKAGAKEAMRYLSQLWQLRFGDTSRRFGKFGLVGALGFLVNMGLLALLTDVGGIYYLLSAIIATQGSTLFNLVLTEAWVFRGREGKRRPSVRAVLFFGMNNLALALRAPMLFALTTGIGINYLVSNFIALASLTILRFGVADGWIWAEAGDEEKKGCWYDVHGIVSVQSDVRLPELERFRVDPLETAPTVRVHVGSVAAAERTAPAPGATRARYVEKLGRFGFGTQIDIGPDSIEVVASRLLRHSPHVLYTNIVEPILRWTFADKGYALVHAACVAVGEDSFLVTARTDTGKTTTILKTLDSQPTWSFVSDDLTLLTPDGRVLTYPKPLTISRHTLHAVKRPNLTWKERFCLVFQSRLHSKGGREFGLMLAQKGFPAATMNSIVQLLVPPPKYHVERLVTGVSVQPTSRLAGMMVIQREGTAGQVVLEPKEALEIILENCDDAYGFPPYHRIETFLQTRRGENVAGKERAIIASALADLPAWLLKSPTRDWFKRLPDAVETALSRRVAASAPHVRRSTMPATPVPVNATLRPE